jgi:hypothetical protein
MLRSSGNMRSGGSRPTKPEKPVSGSRKAAVTPKQTTGRNTLVNKKHYRMKGIVSRHPACVIMEDKCTPENSKDNHYDR